MATQNTLATRLAGWVAQLDYGRIPAPSEGWRPAAEAASSVRGRD
jgi:hypothetical protein